MDFLGTFLIFVIAGAFFSPSSVGSALAEVRHGYRKRLREIEADEAAKERGW
jgi:hypothetical protein